MVATELLKLAMETDEERKARLKKMVATTLLKLAPETEDKRRARLEYLSDNPIYIPNNLYLTRTIYFLEQFIIIGRAKRAPHWSVQSRFRVIYVCRYVGMSVVFQKA